MSFLQNPPPLWTGGPAPGGASYQFPLQSMPGVTGAATAAAGAKTRSQYPITTGTSVFGLKYKDGVVMAADTLGSYGSLSRFTDLQRVIRVNETTVVACSGDYADFQWLRDVIEQKQIDDDMNGPDEQGVTMRPEALHSWITRVLYQRRSRFDPLWTTVIVGGVQDGKPFLGFCDYLGTAYKDDCISTGLGADIATPIMRDVLEKTDSSELSLDQAKELIRKCLEVMFLRDCRASSRYHLAVVSKDAGAVVDEPKIIPSNWELAHQIKGYE